MNAASPCCPVCGVALVESTPVRRALGRCQQCSSLLHVHLFPARFQRAAVGELGERVVLDDDATCYDHSERRAEAVCSSCGRFLCALCDIPMDEEHLCPSCVNTARRKGRIPNLQNERTLYGYLALALAVLPVLTVWGVLAGAPATLWVVFRHWKDPGSIVGRGRIPMVLAALIALLEITGIVALVALFVSEVL